jgi:hypothetical protein
VCTYFCQYSDWATGWTTGVLFPVRQGFFLFSTASRPALGPAHSPIQWVRGGVLSPEVKPPELGADHSPHSSAGISAGNYTFTPPYVFMAWCLPKHRMCPHGYVWYMLLIVSIRCDGKPLFIITCHSTSLLFCQMLWHGQQQHQYAIIHHILCVFQ